MPQTKASLLQRLVAIDLIIDREPQVGWELVLSLLPTRHGYGTPNPKPRLRDPSPVVEEKLTNGIVYQAYGEAVNRAIALARGNADRVLALLKSMDAFRADEMNRVCDEVENLVSVVANSQRLTLWTELRDTVSMHSAHKDAQWAFPSEIVARLRSLQQRLDPQDPIYKVQWLFDKHFPDLDNVSRDQRMTAVDDARSAAVSELHAELGDTGLAQLARQAKFPGLVGVAVGAIFQSVTDFDRMLTAAYSFSDMPDLFPMALSGIALDQFSTDWPSKVVERARQGLSPVRLATLLLGWTNERAAWDLAESFGPEVVQSYWSRRTPYPVRGNVADQERAAREYLRVGHAVAALQILGDATKELPGELVFGRF